MRGAAQRLPHRQERVGPAEAFADACAPRAGPCLAAPWFTSRRSPQARHRAPGQRMPAPADRPPWWRRPCPRPPSLTPSSGRVSPRPLSPPHPSQTPGAAPPHPCPPRPPRSASALPAWTSECLPRALRYLEAGASDKDSAGLDTRGLQALGTRLARGSWLTQPRARSWGGRHTSLGVPQPLRHGSQARGRRTCPPSRPPQAAWSVCPATPEVGEQGGGLESAWPPPAVGGSCLSILQFGSHSKDVWGRPPLPLPLLLSAWPSPARVSAVPLGREEGSARARAPPQHLSRLPPGLLNRLPPSSGARGSTRVADWPPCRGRPSLPPGACQGRLAQPDRAQVHLPAVLQCEGQAFLNLKSWGPSPSEH